jgi:hypothetical protein
MIGPGITDWSPVCRMATGLFVLSFAVNAVICMTLPAVQSFHYEKNCLQMV